MATQLPIHFERDGLRDDGDGKGDAGKQAASPLLPLTTTPPQPVIQDQEDRSSKSAVENSSNQVVCKDVAGKDVKPISKTLPAGLPHPPIKQNQATDTAPSTNKGAGHDTTASTSSIWTSAATTLKNLVIGKPQAPSKDIVIVVPDPKTTRDRAQSKTSQSGTVNLNNRKGKATIPEESGSAPPSENVLPVLDPAAHSTQSCDLKSKPQTRPSEPPRRLSSIAHSLPTTYSHPPAPPQQLTASPSSIQSPNSTASHASDATATSATTATDEENQVAALLALNAVIHSVGTGYTQPLTSRAAQLHVNDQMLAQQREKLLHTSALLAKDTETLRKLAVESNNKLKGLGDLKNWSETLDNDLNAIEETLRLVERGSLDVCSKCEGPIEEEEDQKWCGECGKGFHLACAGEDPDEVAIPTHGPGLDEDEQVDVHEHGTMDPANVELPSSLPSTSTPQQTSGDIAPMSSLFSAFSPAATATQASVPSVPKPSSMFEWGGIPENLWLEDEDGSESASGSGSEWSGESWRCPECRLKDDLDAIGRGL